MCWDERPRSPQAVGRRVADYLQEKIWEPMGAEADATWLIDRAGQEAAYCCLNAVLRDYARLGLLLAHDGHWRGRQIIPAAWIEDATRVRPDQPHLQPGTRPLLRSFGYGNQVWIFAGERRMFALFGIRGQALFLDPASQLVMIHTAVRRQPRDPGNAEAIALSRVGSCNSSVIDRRRAEGIATATVVPCEHSAPARSRLTDERLYPRCRIDRSARAPADTACSRRATSRAQLMPSR
jgi:CubicO group peptidase (beta-lactamase class C family)